MAREQVLFERSRQSSTDLSASQFCGVALNTSSQLALPGAGADIYGVLQNKPTSGQAGDVRVVGMTQMKVGAAGVTAGDKVMVDASGQAVTATTGNFVIGWAEDTAASGQYTSVVLRPGGKI